MTAAGDLPRAARPTVHRRSRRKAAEPAERRGAVIAGLLALYGYYRSRRGRRPEFFLEEIGKIEQLARESMLPLTETAFPSSRLAGSQSNLSKSGWASSNSRLIQE